VKKLTALLGAVALLWGGAHLVSDGGESATVERIIDGDTLDASIKRETVRIRLLNIDTPEIGRDGNPSECFAEEAKQRLAELVPPGTKVHLEYDQERLDKYGRTLAGVFRDDQFVNEQLAREGLGRAMLVEPNSRFYQRILDAESEPRDAGHGIFGATPGCFAANSDVQDAPHPPSEPAVDNYTGCRAYGGNYALNNVDKNGRRYAKIDCTSTIQIG